MLLFSIGLYSNSQLPLFAQEKISNQNNVIIESDIQRSLDISSSFLATGNVKFSFSEKDIKGTSEMAKFLSQDRLLFMQGNVRVENNDGSTLYAEKLFFLIDNDQLIANPNLNNQVELRIILDRNETIQRKDKISI